MSKKEKLATKGSRVSRRDFLKYASASAGITAAALALGKSASSIPISTHSNAEPLLHGHPHNVSVPSQVDGGITPMRFLTDYYKPNKDPITGERVFDLWAVRQPIKVARGVEFPSWAFQAPGRLPPMNLPSVPGPTLRVDEGDTVRINLHNSDTHPHTIHLHGIHPGPFDGVIEILNPGDNYTYGPFPAEPFGLYLYHCHVMPVKKHISKGLYGAFIVDPVTDPLTGQPATRPSAREMVMVMNGFDVDFDDENEFYTVNGIANYYLDNPIKIQVGEPVRIYLVNMTEFDPVNSFHLHGNMFRLYRTGTRFDASAALEPPGNPLNPLADLDQRARRWLYRDANAEVTDTVFLGQGERAIIEFIPKMTHQGGKFLFHAHQSEFLELGWTGLFEVI